nr:transmembrane protein 145-like [Parasteatoda tepidariorum]
MTNDHNSFWFKHFSADEFYILQIDISFLLLYIVLLLLSFIEADALRSRHLFHRTYALYLTSVILECCGLSFTCAYYANLAKEGYALMELKLLGKVIEALSTLFLLVLLILIAKGYTVTRGRLSKITYFEIFVFLFLYILVYAVLFLYEEQFFDPGKVLYIYESPVGYGIIGLRLVGWAWFVYAVTFTMIHYPEKSNFYTKLFLLYSIWFLAAPVVILVSTYVVRKWIREKLINAVELFISISAHFVFFVLTRPSKAKENFPYPVRTSQPLYVNGTRPTAPSAAQINNQNTVEQNEATTTT